jgi:hypothetical protein
MYSILNANVNMYDHCGITISASIEDQSLDTLRKIGRGKMICEGDSMILRYDTKILEFTIYLHSKGSD